MSDSRIIVGYSIIDPDGHYPSTPEYGIGCLEAARQEALALNEDFAEELDGGVYAVVTLSADGTVEHVA